MKSKQVPRNRLPIIHVDEEFTPIADLQTGTIIIEWSLMQNPNSWGDDSWTEYKKDDVYKKVN